MSSFQQILIGGYPGGGLTTDKKPLMLADEAYSTLENAFVWRDRTKKRDGTVPMGRLRRIFSAVSIGASGASPWTFNIYTKLSITPETNATIQPGSVRVTISGIATPFIDQGNGTLTNLTNPGSNFGTINYLTGSVTITDTVGAGAATTLTAAYFPMLPSMGIFRREVATLGIDATVFFDTKYAYQYSSGFQELSPGTTWTAPNNANGTNTYFFWSTNYQGATADLRYFFTTNNNILLTGPSSPAYDPIRYYNNSTWVTFQPILANNPPSAASVTLWQALILIPYYGRLLALNTWEGPTASTYTGAVNFFARCRFSQLGDPTDQINGWRSDIFGRGGFIDAPTNESIVSAAFFRNTLIVFFEYSTWQLRYVGEYGLPFIFERISSDFGAVSTSSPIVFDQGVMAISDRGVIQAAANGVSRLDEQIPDKAFSFEIQNDAPNFVHGIRDYQKEVVYWNFVDIQNDQPFQNWPTDVLMFNYKNNTYAEYRDTITCFGPAQFQFGVTWDSFEASWDSNISWDSVNDQQYVELVASGNQQGFISIYENPNATTPEPTFTLYAPTLAITAITLVANNPTRFTVPQHNLANGEIIYITNTIWLGTEPLLNNQIYQVTAYDVNTITLSYWVQSSLSYSSFIMTTASTYIGGGLITLLPKMNIVGKDFNPFQAQGKQFNLSFIDFQMDSNQVAPAIPAVTVQLYVNSYYSPGAQANILAGNQELLNTSQTCGFITFIAQSNPCVVTSPGYSLPTGTQIQIRNVEGMTQINASVIYTITVIDANTFSLNNINSSGFTAYTKGGIWNSIPVDGQTYIPGSEYAWYRFYSNQYGQYLRVSVTYDDTLMNQLSTHQLPIEINAMNLWMREGGRLIN